MRRTGVGLAFVLLVAAGAGFGALGLRALALERDATRREGERRADLVLRRAAEWAATRAVDPADAPLEAWELEPVREPAALPEGDVLLLHEAEYQERVRGDDEAALRTLGRLAGATPPGDAARIAAVRAGAIELRLGRDDDARRDLAVAAEADASLRDDRGVPVRLAARYLRARADLAAGRDAALDDVVAEAGVGARLGAGGATDAGDLLAELARDAEARGVRHEGLAAAAARAARGGAARDALPADGVVARGDRVLRRAGERIEARPASSLLAGFAGDPEVALRVVPAGTETGDDRTRALGPPLVGLVGVAIPAQPRGLASAPWILAAGLGVYALGLVLAVAALARGARTARLQADFVAAVSHELKTPIASVRAMAELLAERAADEPDLARRYAERIGWEMERLGASVRNVLDAARIERTGALPVTLRPGDPARVVQDAVDAFSPGLDRRGHRFSAEVRAAAAPSALDPEALRGVLANLLDNAAKYGGEAKEIELCAGPEGGGAYRIAVRDRGVGIPPSERERLFGRFFRGRAAKEGAIPGVGLGLHVSREVVEAHGGTLRALPRDGGGTEFVVDLPPESAA